MSEQAIYGLADQFRSVYPDTWETLLTDRLMQNKDKSGDTRRLADKKELIRKLENQLFEVNAANLEKDLDKRIADLQQKLEKIGKEEK
jgi:hypothetical protein